VDAIDPLLGPIEGAGQLDGMQAFMTGKLKLTGDMMFAQSMQAWFAS
jgi:putative sterol carrier protein